MCDVLATRFTGFLLEKKVGVNQPKRLENAKILIANTAMDSDKIKVFGSKVSHTYNVVYGVQCRYANYVGVAKLLVVYQKARPRT